MSSSVKLVLVAAVAIFGLVGAYYAFFNTPPESAGDESSSKGPSAPSTGRGAADRNVNQSDDNARRGTGSTLRNSDPQPVVMPERQERTRRPEPINPDPNTEIRLPPLPSVDPSPTPSTDSHSGKGEVEPASKPENSDSEHENQGPSQVENSVPASSPDAKSPDAPEAKPTDAGGVTPGQQPQPQDQPRVLPAGIPVIKPEPRSGLSEGAKPPAFTDYVVKSGDTMTSIAEVWFGESSKWDLISKANPLVDPQRLKVGQTLKLPAKDAKREPEPSTPRGATGEVTYTVRSGDTLYKIAQAYYSDSSRWKTIYDANKLTIGDDPAELKVGMKLVIPPAPAAAKRP